MHDIRIPNVAQPIKGALCTIGHLYRPEMRGGALIQELWLYEDDLESQTRRVFKVFAPVTPKGRVRRGVPTTLNVLTAKGFDKHRYMWGQDGEARADLTLDGSDASLLIAQATKLIKTNMKRYRDSTTWYRHS
ncbi:hypothetical protein ACQYZY_28625 [Pseudomonas aeruginosa]|uniref:hypothetical protein n=1 Tax=Pseudomonas aeruginosa TaxID=287 RepID=UPI001A285D2B|nr:hypothetical protein [Pseudomonas aeruginosa]MBH8699181.1 hypothetical protein [Pseudomonas aeruginosa]HEK3608658.1 hypothetical protein [Pseudomonas aeruginosa]